MARCNVCGWPIPTGACGRCIHDLARVLWSAYTTTDEIPLNIPWDDLPEPQRSNWLAVAWAAADRGAAALLPGREDQR